MRRYQNYQGTKKHKLLRAFLVRNRPKTALLIMQNKSKAVQHLIKNTACFDELQAALFH